MSDLIERYEVLKLFIEGDGDDEFTDGYNFAVTEYREKVKQILSTSEVAPVKYGMTRMDDLIDRQSVVDIVMCYCPDDDGGCSKAFNDIRELLDEIENLPAVNPCIPCSDKYCKFCDGVSFSEEPFTVITPKDKKVECIFRFCPNCGRKLSEGE